MQIHHVETSFHDRYVVDPEHGQVRRREEVLRCSDITQVSHDGKTYSRDDDGTFDVPDDVAAFLVGRRTGQGTWRTGPNPFADEIAPKRTTRSRKEA